MTRKLTSFALRVVNFDEKKLLLKLDLGVAHLVDLLDEVVVLLPERHDGGWVGLAPPIKTKIQ